METLRNGFKTMRKEFKETIYELLEQSKRNKVEDITGSSSLKDELDKIKKDKPSNKQSISKPKKSPFRYKRVGKNEYEYDFMSYDEWEDMMGESKSIGRNSIKTILKDIVSNVKDGLKMDSDFYDYDRNSFIKMLNKNDGERLELVYPTDIETIATLIIQLSKLGGIKYYNDVDGEDLRKKYRIEE